MASRESLSLSSSQDESYQPEQRESLNQLFDDYVCSDVLDTEEEAMSQVIGVFDDFPSSSSDATSFDTLSSCASSFGEIRQEDLHQSWEPSTLHFNHQDKIISPSLQDNPYSIYRTIPITPAISNSDILRLEGRSNHQRSFPSSRFPPGKNSHHQTDHSLKHTPRTVLERFGRISKPHHGSTRRVNQQFTGKRCDPFKQLQHDGPDFLRITEGKLPETNLPLSPPESAKLYIEEKVSSSRNCRNKFQESFSSTESQSSSQSSTRSYSVQHNIDQMPVTYDGPHQPRSYSMIPRTGNILDTVNKESNQYTLTPPMSASSNSQWPSTASTIEFDTLNTDASLWSESKTSIQEATQALTHAIDCCAPTEELPFDSFFSSQLPSFFSTTHSQLHHPPHPSFPTPTKINALRVLGTDGKHSSHQRKSSSSSRSDYYDRSDVPMSSSPVYRPHKTANDNHRPLKSKVKRRKKPKSSKSSAAGAVGIGGSGFVNFTPDDSHKILGGVAPSGSSKTKLRREREAREQRQRFQMLTVRAAREGRLERLLCEVGV